MPSATTTSSDQAVGLFVCLIAILVGFGTLMVHSASITSWPTEFERIYVQKHLAFLVVGIIAGFCSSQMPSRVWYALARPLFWGTCLLLILVLVPGIGTRVNGAQRWIRSGPISLQPSELCKITLPLLICRMLHERREGLSHWLKGTIPFGIPTAIAFLLVVREPDLGTALFLLIGVTLALFLGGWPIRHFVTGLVLVAPPAVLLVGLKPYQLKRITGFLDAWRDVNQAPYQLKQSLLSLGAGGMQGVGLGRGWQKLSFLPEANTDFVFAVVGEELGLIGTLGLITVWILLLLTGLKVVKDLPARSFERTLALTLLIQLALQAAVNVAVVTAMVPPKGIPHPLLSYGGNSMVTSLISFGIIISMGRNADRSNAVSKAD